MLGELRKKQCGLAGRVASAHNGDFLITANLRLNGCGSVIDASALKLQELG